MTRPANDWTLCLTYLRYELRYRWWQSLATATGLAVGVALVITVTAAAGGASAAESRVLENLDHAAIAGGTASEIGGAVVTASAIIADLGMWVAVAALTASCAGAALLTLASVARRVREFGTLKALGWSVRRITAQVLTESVTGGIAGTLAGTALGCAAAGLISLLSPTLTVNVTDPPNPGSSQPSAGHNGPVLVHFSAVVSPGTVALAVTLGILGALVAGALGAWRAARLPPATALAKPG